MSTASTVARGSVSDSHYTQFLRQFNVAVNAVAADEPLFTTDADPQQMWELYLASFSNAEERQHHNCNACRHFIERYGGLVMIDSDNGEMVPAMWYELQPSSGFYVRALRNLRLYVSSRKVTGVFVSDEKVLGTPQTGVWSHLHVACPAGCRHTDRVLTPFQASAAKAENYRTMKRALADFDVELIRTALALLDGDTLYRSEKVRGPVQFLMDTKQAVIKAAARGLRPAENMLWRRVATAPEGFCHPRSSMAGTLLEDLAAGMSVHKVKQRFAEKMHPLRYMRPQAAPAAGNVRAAADLFQTLGVARALERRYLRLDEVQAIWWSQEHVAKRQELPHPFQHLKTKAPKSPIESHLGSPARTMTWVKFMSDVLPDATRIEVYLGHEPASLGALTTAVHADAPPILKWDRPEARNPVAWYVWRGGSAPSQFGLNGGRWHSLEAVALRPWMWSSPEMPNEEKGACLLIRGAIETRYDTGAAIFPETLHGDFHGVRATIEQYSRQGHIKGHGKPHAAGLLMTEGRWDIKLRAVVNNVMREFIIDRWD